MEKYIVDIALIVKESLVEKSLTDVDTVVFQGPEGKQLMKINYFGFYGEDRYFDLKYYNKLVFIDFR